ncbi:glycosyl transferase family 2 [Pedobacter ginsengisoli]|uniref:Glycosyl transferase family 2 n=1 Tax=Pedobacter ginsengisoli TaxID=363852 RepID=A0A2D1UA38_9SPHI|nr:glycosyltransferase family 2 protein [Pedobacter ginsengisoli]ATP58498.1 glycosyl transferase family 2 [Pedobacter ginsengisoli]
MQKQITVALLISTYNWPEALDLSLSSVLLQSKMPDEILIADDGSTEETKIIIEKYKKLFNIPILHFWQEDLGFRKTLILNKAIAGAKSDYIIEIDGDIIIHRKFIEDHINFAIPGTFVRASRGYLSKKLSAKLVSKQVSKINIFNKNVDNFFSVIRIPFLWPLFEKKYKIKGDELYEIHGCNMAFWRSDAIKVNGYNESFTGWGPEDKEFIARLLNIGVKKRFLKLGAVAFHIYHKENSRASLAENQRLFKETIALKKVYCEYGINQYL